MTEIPRVCYLLLSLLGGGLVNGACIRFGWLKWLARPIDGNKTWRGKRLFGANKTFRGIFAVALGNALVWHLQADVLHSYAAFRNAELFNYASVEGWILGFAVGAAAMIAELPNSFVKRRLNVPPGGSAHGLHGILLYIWDQVDLLAGVWLVLALVMRVSLLRISISVALALLVHPLTAWIGFAWGMRHTRR